MSDNEKFAIAARLYVQLRRKVNRSIDTVWMVHSNEYAREILRIARAEADADLQQLANHFEALMTGTVPSPLAAGGGTASNSKYVGTLR